MRRAGTRRRRTPCDRARSASRPMSSCTAPIASQFGPQSAHSCVPCEHTFEVVHVDAVGDETRPPVLRSQLDAVHGTPLQRGHTGAPEEQAADLAVAEHLAPVPSRRTRPPSSTTP